VDHPNLQSCVFADPDDVDLLDDDHDGWLDDQAGHGAFICGLVHLVSPGLGIDPARVLDSTGFGDDLSVALGLAETSAPVINLSLGGYTQDDNPPLALAQAIAALGRSRIVVAAAGNNHSDRPFWPAALKGVVAVAAYDSLKDAPASFSNFGPWVDVCAPGVGVLSTFVEGERREGSTDVTFKGWARWSGTSFAAPLVAAEIAGRIRRDPSRGARQVTFGLLSELPESGWQGFGARYTPETSPTA
jgi:subtilisin family serine protease